MTRSQVLIIAVFVVALVLTGYKRMSALGPNASQPIAAPQFDEPLATHPSTETAVFAGGCFWGTQSVFQRVKGVTPHRSRLLRRCRLHRHL